MDHSKKWGKWFGNIVYKQADRKKLGRKDFEQKISESHNVGLIKGFELALETLKDSEDRGDIHILMVDAQESFEKLNPGKLPRACVERNVRIYER